MIKKNTIIDNIYLQYFISSGFDPKGTIVFLHGWGSNAESFKNIFEKYENAVAVDLPGFGGSGMPPQDWTISTYAQVIHKLLTSLHILNPIFVGHSFGGRITLRYNTLFTPPTKNILIGAAGFRNTSFKIRAYKVFSKLFNILFGLPFLSRWKNTLRKKFYKNIQAEDYLNSGTLKQVFQNTINEDLTQDMQKITVPTILIWGSDDDTSPLAHGKRMHALIPNSKLIVMDGAGHYPFLDKPEEFNKVFFKYN